MSTKISNLNELYPIVSDDEKISEGVLAMACRFDVKRLMKPLTGFKKRGISLLTVFSSLLLCRFRGLSVYSMYRSGQVHIDENTIYRMMNHSQMNWRSLLLNMAAQFLKTVKQHGTENNNVRCFVIDDTDIPKSGITMEGISKIFSHVTARFILGYKMLNLCLWDGKSFLPLDFSLHRENAKHNWGLPPKELKKQFRKQRSDDCPAMERLKELDLEKTTVALQMLRRACKHNILANYALMDSWFVNDTMIQGIRKIRKGMLHIVGMCKMDIRKFTLGNHELKSEAIIKRECSRKGAIRKSRLYKSQYIKVDAIYKGTAVRLFYIKYGRSEKWKLLLTTDMSLSFTKAMELYHIRWSIEVMYRECKQHLRLGEAQNTDFDGQIADITVTLITHLMLSLQLRFQAYETMGGLFRKVQNQIIQDTLHQRIMQTVLEIIGLLLEILSIDIEQTIEQLMVGDEQSEKVLKLLIAVKEMNNTDGENKNVARDKTEVITAIDR